MKILTISNSTSGHGSYGRHRRMARALIDSGHEVYWLAPGMEHPGKETFLSIGNTRLPNLGPSVWLLKLWLAFRRYKNELAVVDAVFTLREYDAIACQLYPTLKRIPHVFFQRGDTIECEKFNIKYPIELRDRLIRPITLFLYPFIQKYLFPKLDLVVVQSGFLKRILKERYPHLDFPIYVLPNDCNIKWYHEESSDEKYNSIINLKNTGLPLLGMVAPSYWYGRGFDVLFAALEQLKSRVNYKALLIGYGPQERRIRDQIKSSQLENSIFFIGRVTNAYRLIHLFDMMVVPTRQLDACSNVVLEAMASEICILASDIDSHQALLEYPELLFRSEDPFDLSRKIEELILSKSKRAKNRKLVKKRKEKFSFDWDREVVTLVSALVGGKE